MISGLVFFALLVVLFLLLRSDLRERRLSNGLILIYALLFIPYALVLDIQWGLFVKHAVCGLAAFLILLLLFARGGIGGGDVKLGAVMMLWAGPGAAMSALFVTGIAGALLGIIGWLVDRWPEAGEKGRRRCSLQRVRFALSARRGVPYGVALIAGSIVALAEHAA